MPRLLVGNQWYDAIRSQSWFERDYEALILSRSAELFPAWRCVPFSEVVEGEDGTRKRPDLALIDLQYRHWWVVEVELSHHNLFSHVIPQVDVFRTGTYGERHADALRAKAPELDATHLETMLRGSPPDVLVVVDSPRADWSGPLRERRVQLAIVEPFRGMGPTVALRVNGDQPQPHPTMLSHCSRGAVRRLLKVHSPAALPDWEGGLMIEFQGAETRWDVVQLQDAVMLRPERGDVLGDAAAVDLVRRDDGGLAFRPISTTTQSRRRPR